MYSAGNSSSLWGHSARCRTYTLTTAGLRIRMSIPNRTHYLAHATRPLKVLYHKSPVFMLVTACKRLAEACASRTHRRHQRCRPPVLKTGTVTGRQTLPCTIFNRLQGYLCAIVPHVLQCTIMARKRARRTHGSGGVVLKPEDRMRFGTAVVVEPRYIGPILHGIVSDGLTLEQRTEDLLLGQECDWSDAMVQPLRQ
jgi:hypothetical protein